MLNIVGQSRAIGQLQRALSSGRLASTWMFAGPQGVGKFTTACAMARTALCEAPVRKANRHADGLHVSSLPDDFMLTLACGHCESCKACDVGVHPDLHLISRQLVRFHDSSGKSKASTLSISVIRGEITGDSNPERPVESKLYKRSQRGRGKWFIIDEADLMQHEAQNALLKALEEPPPQTYLVMITASPADLLTTIRSRSQQVQFNALPTDMVIKQLGLQGVTAADAAIVARLSGGSIGCSLDWLGLMEADKADAAKRAARANKPRAGGDDDADSADDSPDAADAPPSNILDWTTAICKLLDDMVVGRAGAMQLATIIQKNAEDYARRQLRRDPLTSKEQAKRAGIAIMLAIIGHWLDDRLRQYIGAAIEVPLPATTHALSPASVRRALAVLRSAENHLDSNAHQALLLAANMTALRAAVSPQLAGR